MPNPVGWVIDRGLSIFVGHCDILVHNRLLLASEMYSHRLESKYRTWSFATEEVWPLQGIATILAWFPVSRVNLYLRRPVRIEPSEFQRSQPSGLGTDRSHHRTPYCRVHGPGLERLFPVMSSTRQDASPRKVQPSYGLMPCLLRGF